MDIYFTTFRNSSVHCTVFVYLCIYWCHFLPAGLPEKDEILLVGFSNLREIWRAASEKRGEAPILNSHPAPPQKSAWGLGLTAGRAFVCTELCFLQ